MAAKRKSLYSEWREFGGWELREGVLCRASELEALLEERVDRHPDNQRVQVLAQRAFSELHEARQAVSHSAHPWFKTGSHLTVAQIHLDTAHNLFLRLSEPDEVIPMMPGLRAFVQAKLPPSDPRRIKVEIIDKAAAKTGNLESADLESILDAVGVARQAGIGEAVQIRSFVNITGWVTFILVVAAVVVALLGVVQEDAVPLCFTPTQGLGHREHDVVCPIRMSGPVPKKDINNALAKTTSPGDYLVVEIVGLVAAGIAAATSLRKIRGTSTPYNVPVVLAALKLPTGALTAVLGLLLMRGGFVPGLSALDSSAQIIAWSIIFGYSQQLFTRLVDDQARALAGEVDAAHAAPSSPPTSPQAGPAAPQAADSG
ncbi:hypothetical protein [Streptomyces triticiradicis]|uniref:Uncharacterized protein n=1 Tax=Streptomyces triticiradicis TaxID=2651189 RepID=A0A7J5D5M5_9ACTN|nr:hypothetical protein [Streptomyces triticiradicis]KAB1978560.1 hypothetical protein F8144_39730 [Streptomyces triticiradicis]